MGIYIMALEWLEGLMIPCFFKAMFNTECPGCGLQRSLFLLMRGNVAGSINMYWATIPIVLMFVFLWFHLKFKFKMGNQTLIFLYSINGILIFCQYFYKLSNQH